MSRLISKMSTMKKEANIKVEFITFYKFCVTVMLLALSVKVGVQLKDVKNIKNEVQSKLDSISKQLNIKPQKISLGNINNLRTELQSKLDQVAKNLKLNLSGINISGVDTAKIKELLGNVKVKPKLDTGQIIADTNTLVSQIRSKVESAIGNGTIGKISINTGSNGEFLGAKVTAQLDNADTKVIKLNKDLEILGETFNQNSSKMANALASQNKYLDSQITKLKSYKQAVQGSGGGSVSKQMELNNALDVQIRKLEQLKSSNELLGNAEKARISETTNALKTQTSQLTKYDSSFKNTFGRMLQYFGSGSVIYGFVNQVKTGVNQIIELDDAMRDLRKVADATTEQLEGFTKVANGMAKEVGASTEGIVKSTELYSKLGYAMDEASERAKNANIFSNISDMDIDDATKALITIQKGFGMDSMEDMMTIMDATNEVGNKFSSSTQDIAEGLKEFSSTSLEAGNNLQESIGLFVSANASIQDSSRAGNALKTIIMRLRGMSTELDETGVPASKLREAIKAITASAGQMVDIMKDDNTFKSTTEILKELSEVYPKLTDAQKAWMQKNIAGVHQGNVYASIMKNMQEGIDATSTALDSNGSALKENAIYMDSASAKINEFKETLKEIWINTIDSSAIKGVVEGGTAILNIFNKMTTTFGTFPTVIGTVVAGLTLFNAKFREMQTAYQPTILSKMVAQLNVYGNTQKAVIESIRLKIAEQKKEIVANQMSGKSIEGMKTNLMSLNGQLVAATAKMAIARIGAMALSTAFSMGISLAISAAITAVDNFIHREEKLAEFNEDLRSSFETLGSDVENLEGLADQFTTLNEEMKNSSLSAEELSAKKNELASVTNQLIQKYPELDGLINNETTSYEEQKEAIQGVIDAKKEEQALKADEYFDKNDINGSGDIKKLLNEAKSAQEMIANSKKSIEDLVRENPQYDADSSVIKSMYEQSHENLTKYKEDLVEYKQQIRDIIAYEKALDVAGAGRFSDQEINNLKELLNSLNAYESAQNSAEGATKGVNEVVEEQSDVFERAKEAMNGYGDSIDTEGLQKAFKDSLDNYENLIQLQNELNENGMSANFIKSIASDYPQLLAYMGDQNAMQEQINNLIAEEERIQTEAYNQMMANDEAYYNQKFKMNNEFLNAVVEWARQFVGVQAESYRDDLQNCNSLAQAKTTVINQMIDALANMQRATVSSFNTVAGIGSKLAGGPMGAFLQGTTGIVDAAIEQATTVAIDQYKAGFDAVAAEFSGYSPSGFKNSVGGSGGSGSKGGSGSGSAKEGTYLEDLYDRYSELQKAIDRCANAYDLLEEKKKNASEKDKLKYIKEQIDLINKQKDAVNALRNEQQKQYNELKGYLQGKGFNINSDGAITNYSRIKELTAWAGTNDDRKKEVEAINDAIKEFNDLVQNDMPNSRKEFESLTNTIAELNEEMKDIYKSELELVTDAQEEIVDIIKDRLDKQKELLDKEYEDRKESLEKTKKLYQDQNAEEDYAEELAEEQKKLDEMKNSLIDLQRDVSGNSDALIADMKKQIEEQEKVIRDKQKDYERSKTEQALDQAIEDIENEKEAMDKQWEEQYSEANIVQMATQALNTGLINLNGEVVSLQDAMIQFENSTGQGKIIHSPYVQKCA